MSHMANKLVILDRDGTINRASDEFALVLRDIAIATELHESTVSRVTTNKYMSTPFGTFELKYFFGSALGTDSGANASSTAVRALRN